MGILEHLREKTEKNKKMKNFESLSELYTKAKKMTLDLEKQESDFYDYFDKYYPGLAPQLESLIKCYEKYYAAFAENQILREQETSLSSEFANIDGVFRTKQVIDCNTVDKFIHPEIYNIENVKKQMDLINSVISQCKDLRQAEILRKYVKNAEVMNKNFSKLSVKNAISHDFWQLVENAVHQRSAITVQYPYVNYAINDYNTQLEQCQILYGDEIKNKNFQYLDNVNVLLFKNGEYYRLLERALYPKNTRFSEKNKMDDKYKKQPITM